MMTRAVKNVGQNRKGEMMIYKVHFDEMVVEYSDPEAAIRDWRVSIEIQGEVKVWLEVINEEVRGTGRC